MSSVDHALQAAAQHHQQGRAAEAEAMYRQALALDPSHPGALYGLGVLALQAERYAIAEDLIRRAIAVKGEWPEGCYHLGVALQAREQYEPAIMAHRRAIALNPDLFDAQYNLAVCLQISGQRDKAIAAYERAIAIKQDNPFLLVNFAIALQGAGRIDESIAALKRAVAIKGDFAEAFCHLGISLREAGLLDQAVAASRRACDLMPRDYKAQANLAAALWESGLIKEAIAVQRQAIALKPADPDAHWVLGNLLLLCGDFAQGLPEFEWRLRKKILPWPRRLFSQPRWDGSDLNGRTIYLHAEQSIGDTIQFIRFVPRVLHRGGKVIVECQQSLRRLFEGNWDVQQWISPGDPLPGFDVYCPLLSLPLMLRIKPDSIPSQTPYLQAPSGRPLLAGKSLKVGLAWAGSPSELQDRKRSVSLSRLSPLAEVAGVEFYSLQKGWAAAQARDADAGIALIDFTHELSDFADTAALIAQLDLVISVDTAVAHLAGALGKPVWTILPFVPHWRWMLEGEHTPWYPSMRLFRQTSLGDWGDVISRVTGELNSLANPPQKS